MPLTRVCDLAEWAGYPIQLSPPLMRAFDHVHPGGLLILPQRHPEEIERIKQLPRSQPLPPVTVACGFVLYQVIECPLSDERYQRYRATGHSRRYGKSAADLAVIMSWRTQKQRLIIRHPMVGLLLFQDRWRLPLRHARQSWLDAEWRPVTPVGTGDDP